jgi:hypothetical protein
VRSFPPGADFPERLVVGTLLRGDETTEMERIRHCHLPARLLAHGSWLAAWV